MIRDLVDFARLEYGELRLHRTAADLGAFVSELRDRLVGVLDVQRVRAKLPEDLPPVHADPDRLKRILTNLLSNALKYSSPRTQVVLAATRGGRRGGGVGLVHPALGARSLIHSGSEPTSH